MEAETDKLRYTWAQKKIIFWMGVVFVHGEEKGSLVLEVTYKGANT